jgi:hypothetical protein
MATPIQRTSCLRICMHQYIQTRNSFKEPNACATELLVYSARNGIYTFVCNAWRSNYSLNNTAE